MNSISAQEIERRGIAAVDELLPNGDLHVTNNDQPQYVVLSEGRYRELIEVQGEAYAARVLASLDEVKVGKAKRGTAAELLKQLGLDG